MQRGLRKRRNCRFLLKNIETMRKSALFIALLALISLASCSPRLSPFTRNVYEKANLSDEALKKVQFYLSDDLILTRDIEETGEAQVLGGKIKLENGRKVEIVRFDRGTPGVFLFRPEDDHFAIAFESGDDTRYLVFGPNPKMEGRYVLLASEWKNRRGTVTYSGQKFRTNEDAFHLNLIVNLKRIRTDEVEARRAKGRKID